METWELSIIIFLAMSLLLIAIYLFFEYRLTKEHAAAMSKKASRRNELLCELKADLENSLWESCHVKREEIIEKFAKEKHPIE